jgi:predicted ATPase with chaperone activity
MQLPWVVCGPFVLIAAQNPCPCGWHGDPVKECTCSMSTVSRYQKRISGPLLDRIDTRSALKCREWAWFRILGS